MAEITISGAANSKLTYDEQAKTITIVRDTTTGGAALPNETIYNLADLDEVVVKTMAFGNDVKGSAVMKFMYPGCKDNNDWLMGFTYSENMFQYKLHQQEKADKVLALVGENVKVTRQK